MYPVVSVVMSVNTSGRFLYETISSILNQTYQDIEYIIVNDGSVESVNKIINKFTDSRLVILNQSWQGLTKSLNNAIKNSQGQYIARMDADDVSLPNRIQKQVMILDNNPAIGLVGTSYFEISMDGELLSTTLFSDDLQKIKQNLLFQNQFCHGSVMFRKQCIEKVGLYREEFRRAQDYDLWLRIADHYEIINLREPLYKRRLDPNSISIASKYEQNYFAHIARECAKARKQGKEEPLHKLHYLHDRYKSHYRFKEKQKLSQYYFHRGRLLLIKRELKSARIFFLKSYKMWPLRLYLLGFTFATFLPKNLIDTIEPTWKKIQKKFGITI